MPNSWKNALKMYSYPVNLQLYKRKNEVLGFFERNIEGDRKSTIEFENYYQAMAPKNIAVFFEVIFWKLYSQRNWVQRTTNRIMEYIRKNEITSTQLWNAIQKFVKLQNIENLKEIRNLLGISTNVLAIPLTLPALASPETIPMIDTQVAKWVNANLTEHNTTCENKLTRFKMNSTTLRDNDFPNYLNWINWCQEMAHKLSKFTNDEWRARDVEMAVFTAQRNKQKKMTLNPLP